MNRPRLWPQPTRQPDAVSLVDRLVALDAAMLDVELQNTVLKRQLQQALVAGQSGGSGAGGSGAFDFPRTQHVWPLADDPTRDPADLDQYERRVDDDVFAVAQAGAAFMDRFGLLDDAPDFIAAARSLAETTPVLALCDADAAAPDVSIIIPVYGQLAYTLSCLGSLLAHRSSRRVEIIVVDDVSPDETPTVLPLLSKLRIHRPAQNGGFIASCNAGAAMARGTYLVMLNNDTRVLPGWLDALIDSFAIFPMAGLVGSKLLYPDGTLQEAGGIIWRDGSGWNYGRNDDPNRPQYCHARQVDFISGASIALPAELWATLGGFDALYSPAYYEDSDIAFRVVEAGREVWYQPQSRIIHYEGKTSGTDTSAGVKAYQITNQGKFFLRWRERLMQHRRNGDAPYFEAQRRVQKRALVIEPTCPTPKQDAGSVYTVMILRLFQALGYKTTFLAQDNFLFQPEPTTDLQSIGIECAYAPFDLGFDNYIRQYGFLFDIVMVLRIDVLRVVIDDLTASAPNTPVLFNVHDLHFLRMQRAATLISDGAALERAATTKTMELGLMRQVDCVLTPSTYEVQVLNEELPGMPARVLPLMTDTNGKRTPFDQRRDICFLGGYGHQPNVDAVLYFVDAVFPLIKDALPDMRFIIAGANPTAEIAALACDDIVVTGMIDDLGDVLDSARIFVCPLRYGAGAKGKLVTAMAYGVPIVSTAVGVEGMALADGEHALLADTPEQFAAACLQLYDDEPLWHRLSAAGLVLVEEHYSFNAGIGALAAAIETAFRHKLGLLDA